MKTKRAASNERLEGRATPAGTAAFAARSGCDPSHFRRFRQLLLSSLGAGSYLGELDDETDAQYARSLRRSLERGINVFDTALSYRCQRSERVLGRVLGEAVAEGIVARDEVWVATKAGYLTGDGQLPDDPHTYFEQTYFSLGIVPRAELAANCHALNPAFLDHQLERSRENLGLDTIDLFYLHNPETQRLELSPAQFRERMRRAFVWAEQAVSERRIGGYGIATWEGLRRADDALDYLSLSALLELARESGGPSHHFQGIELPLNLAMSEAYLRRNQAGDSVLRQAERAGLFVASSASILQGRLAALELAFEGSGLSTSAQHALQLVRSTPGVSSALVGMRRVEHVEENAALRLVPTLDEQAVAALFALAT